MGDPKDSKKPGKLERLKGAITDKTGKLKFWKRNKSDGGEVVTDGNTSGNAETASTKGTASENQGGVVTVGLKSLLKVLKSNNTFSESCGELLTAIENYAKQPNDENQLKMLQEAFKVLEDNALYSQIAKDSELVSGMNAILNFCVQKSHKLSKRVPYVSKDAGKDDKKLRVASRARIKRRLTSVAPNAKANMNKLFDEVESNPATYFEAAKGFSVGPVETINRAVHKVTKKAKEIAHSVKKHTIGSKNLSPKASRNLKRLKNDFKITNYTDKTKTNFDTEQLIQDLKTYLGTTSDFKGKFDKLNTSDDPEALFKNLITISKDREWTDFISSKKSELSALGLSKVPKPGTTSADELDEEENNEQYVEEENNEQYREMLYEYRKKSQTQSDSEESDSEESKSEESKSEESKSEEPKSEEPKSAKSKSEESTPSNVSTSKLYSAEDFQTRANQKPDLFFRGEDEITFDPPVSSPVQTNDQPPRPTSHEGR